MESRKNMHRLLRLGDRASTSEVARALGCSIESVLHRLRRYKKAGYLHCHEVREPRTDYRGNVTTRRLFYWTPTDKLRELVENDAKALAIEMEPLKPKRIINSVFALGVHA